MRASSFVSGSIIIVSIGCGGAAETGLFGDPTGGGGGGGGQGSPDAAASDGAVTLTDGGTRISDGGGRSDARVTDSGMMGTDAGMGSDTSPPPPANRINCNTMAVTCTLSTQVCCRAGDAPPSFSCAPAAGCNAIGNLPIPCDDADDCTKLGHPGDLCCAQTMAGKANSVSCLPAASCGNNSTNLCDPLAADPCPNGGSCQVSVTTLPGFHICF